ncbi:MAG: hypothetical protein AN482_17880 [Anabaena sp. LE011-02]|nr:MAG: hypothetical protein AN482_17880 [Anabaena sp. LE011-02]
MEGNYNENFVYRGSAPLNWSILNGGDNTGVTLYCLNELMDGGDIVAQKHIPIEFESICSFGKQNLYIIHQHTRDVFPVEL